jgi:hypothetical protein
VIGGETPSASTEPAGAVDTEGPAIEARVETSTEPEAEPAADE